MTTAIQTQATSGKKNGLRDESMPIRALPVNSVLRYGCADCGREEEEYVSRLVKDARAANATPAERAESKACARTGCGGSVTVNVDTQD